MRDHPNPKIQELIDRARGLGTSQKVIDLMVPFWQENVPSIEQQVRDKMLSAPPERPPLEIGTLEEHRRFRLGLPRVEEKGE